MFIEMFASWYMSDLQFEAKVFLEKHPQFDWMNGILKDRSTQPWTVFRAGEAK